MFVQFHIWFIYFCHGLLLSLGYTQSLLEMKKKSQKERCIITILYYCSYFYFGSLKVWLIDSQQKVGDILVCLLKIRYIWGRLLVFCKAIHVFWISIYVQRLFVAYFCTKIIIHTLKNVAVTYCNNVFCCNKVFLIIIKLFYCNKTLLQRNFCCNSLLPQTLAQ